MPGEKNALDSNALRKLGYGMYVISSFQGEKFNGQIANTVFQITSEPPTVAVSINKTNLTHEYIRSSGVFAASVLCESTPMTFIGRFGFRSGRTFNKFDGVSYKIGKTGAPVVLDFAVAYMEARVIRELDVGTHTIFVGEVVAGEVVSEEKCMTYEFYHEIKRGKTPKAAATYIAERKPAQPEGKAQEVKLTENR